jgi:predicted transcriptional regulator
MIVPQTDLLPLDDWQIEEIRRALEEADRGEFAADEEVQRIRKKWTTSNLRLGNDNLRATG